MANCLLKSQSIMFELLRLALSEEETFSCNKLSDEELECLFDLSKKHDITQIIAYALDKSGYSADGDKQKALLKKFNERLYKAVIKYERAEKFVKQIKEVCNSLKIPFVILKGWVTKDYYPEKYLRTFCDIDVLIKEEDYVKNAKEIARALDLKVRCRTAHDTEYVSPDGDVLEIHHSLVEAGRAANSAEVLKKVWDNACLSEGFEYKLSKEFFLFYHIAHMAKHIEGGGLGIRSFIDLELLSNLKIDAKTFESFLKEAKLTDFYIKSLDLCKVWFGNKNPDKTDDIYSKYIICAGVYGNEDNYVVTKIAGNGGKKKFFLSKVFLSYENLAELYPSLRGKKILTPFYQIKRWFSKLFNGSVKKHLRLLRKANDVSQTKKQETVFLFKELGL